MARSDVLVSADWAESNLDNPTVVFVEVDEDASAYDTGHIPGAVKLDWKKDLQDPVKRDFVDAQQFSKLLSDRGISNDDTVVLYGGNNNWFAAYAYWYFKLYGHQDVRAGHDESFRLRVWVKASCGGVAQPVHQRVELATEADAECRVEERGEKREGRGDHTEQWHTESEAGDTDDREDESD